MLWLERFYKPIAFLRCGGWGALLTWGLGHVGRVEEIICAASQGLRSSATSCSTEIRSSRLSFVPRAVCAPLNERACAFDCARDCLRPALWRRAPSPAPCCSARSRSAAGQYRMAEFRGHDLAAGGMVRCAGQPLACFASRAPASAPICFVALELVRSKGLS